MGRLVDIGRVDAVFERPQQRVVHHRGGLRLANVKQHHHARVQQPGRIGGARAGDVAAVQQVTEADEELLLISAGGQVIRTETNTINRYSSAARGVIVMRLAEGDRVVAIAAFRAGLAEQDGMGDDVDPGTGGASPAGPGPGG